MRKLEKWIKQEDVLAYPLRRGHCHENANEHFINGVESVMEYVENLPPFTIVKVQKKGPILEWKCRACGHMERTAGGWDKRFWEYCPYCGATEIELRDKKSGRIYR